MATSLPRATCADAGVDARGILEFTKAAEEIGLHSYMLLRHGKVAAEGWWKPFSPAYTHQLFSLSKSFTSTAVGFAVQEGLLTVSDKLVDFFPEYFPDGAKGNLARVTLQDLLTMSCGHESEPSVLDGVYREDWKRRFFDWPVPLEPGTHFLYNTTGTYMLSAVITRVTGRSVMDYLKPRLFEPLGITDIHWETCPRGISAGGFGLNLHTEDIAKFGQLMLQRGMWEGRRIIDSAWVDEATAWHIQNHGNTIDWRSGYGYQFWRCSKPDTYRGDGAYGQLCVVMKEYDAVFACTGRIRDFQEIMDAIWNHLMPAMPDGEVTGTAAAEAEAKFRNESLTLPFTAGNVPYRTEGTSSYHLAGAPYGLQALTLKFGADADSVTVTDSCGTYTLPVGHGCWLEGETADRRLCGSFDSVMRYAAAQGAWDDGHTYRFAVQYTRSPMVDFWTLRFGENGAAVSYRKEGSFIGGAYAFAALPGEAG